MQGSGTRVVAAILQESGISLGNDLNKMLDNLFFSRPLNYPRMQQPENRDKVVALLPVFEKWMAGKALSGSELRLYLDCSRQNAAIKRRTLKLLQLRLKNLGRRIFKAKPQSVFSWKEPVNQILLPVLAAYFSELKYIHVFKQGLNMAYTNHTAIIETWGDFHGIKSPENKALIPAAMLEFWIKTQGEVLHFAQHNMPGRILFVSLEKLCEDPENECKRIVEFAGISPTNELISRIKTIPQTPKTLKRHQERDHSVFSADQLERCEALDRELMVVGSW